MDTIFNISETRETYTFKKLEILMNNSSFFVKLIRGPEDDVSAQQAPLVVGPTLTFYIKGDVIHFTLSCYFCCGKKTQAL